MHELLEDLISVTEVMDVRVKTILDKMGLLHHEQKVTNQGVEKLLETLKKEEPAQHVQVYTSSQASSSYSDYGEEGNEQEEEPQA